MLAENERNERQSDLQTNFIEFIYRYFSHPSRHEMQSIASVLWRFLKEIVDSHPLFEFAYNYILLCHCIMSAWAAIYYVVRLDIGHNRWARWWFFAKWIFPSHHSLALLVVANSLLLLVFMQNLIYFTSDLVRRRCTWTWTQLCSGACPAVFARPFDKRSKN